jgi:hypothetical protein
MTLKYVIQPDSISFYDTDKQKTSIVYKGAHNIIYDVLELGLRENDIELVYTSQYAKPTEAVLNKLFQSGKDAYGLRERYEALVSEGLPTKALLNFASRAPMELLQNQSLMQRVGTVDMPLTWEGDLVLYQRASWLQSTNERTPSFDSFRSSTKWVDSFTPFAIIEGEGNLASDFDWAMNQCPDTGTTYEVVVQPQPIVSMSYNRQRLYNVNRLTQLSDLGRHIKASQKSTVGVVEITSEITDLGGIIAVRQPFNTLTLSNYISAVVDVSASPTLEKAFSSEVLNRMNNKVVQQVQTVGVSC